MAENILTVTGDARKGGGTALLTRAEKPGGEV